MKSKIITSVHRQSGSGHKYQKQYLFMSKKILMLLVLIITFSACEKDDVCTEETTPRLIIEFYDITNNANAKNVVDLKVKADGAPDYMVFNELLPTTDQSRYLFNGNKLQLPLKVGENSTTYHLIYNSNSTTGKNEDILLFNYTPENVFVSRACGYKTIFTLDNPNGVTVSDASPADGLWLQQANINTLTTNITTENETHIKIYF